MNLLLCYNNETWVNLDKIFVNISIEMNELIPYPGQNCCLDQIWLIVSNFGIYARSSALRTNASRRLSNLRTRRVVLHH